MYLNVQNLKWKVKISGLLNQSQNKKVPIIQVGKNLKLVFLDTNSKKIPKRMSNVTLLLGT